MSNIQKITEISDGIEITAQKTAVFTVWSNQGREFQFEASAEQLSVMINKLQSIADRLEKN